MHAPSKSPQQHEKNASQNMRKRPKFTNCSLKTLHQNVSSQAQKALNL
jgi:hypothetical protein